MNPVRLAHLNAFFIHYDWMKDYIPEIRAMLRMIPDAVEQRYPNDAIVLHARDSEKKYLQRILSSDMVLAILDRYNYTRQSLDIWNVSEPRTGDGASSGETLQRQVALWRGFFKCLWHADASKDIDFVRIVYILANGCNLGQANHVHYPVHTTLQMALSFDQRDRG